MRVVIVRVVAMRVMSMRAVAVVVRKVGAQQALREQPPPLAAAATAAIAAMMAAQGSRDKAPDLVAVALSAQLRLLQPM